MIIISRSEIPFFAAYFLTLILSFVFMLIGIYFTTSIVLSFFIGLALYLYLENKIKNKKTDC